MLESSLNPPGPHGFPLIGVTRDFVSNPLRFLTDNASRYGSVVGFNYLFRRAYQVNDVALARVVLENKEGNFTKQRYAFGLLDHILGKGLLTSDGDLWNRQRARLGSAFGNRELPQFAKITMHEVSSLLEIIENSERGSALSIDGHLSCMTLAIIAKAMMEADPQSEIPAFRQSLEAVNKRFAEVMYHPVKAGCMQLSIAYGSGYSRELRVLNDCVKRMVSRKRQDFAAPHGPTFISQLLQEDVGGAKLGDAQVRDEVVTVLMAGHETTANAIKWLLLLTGRHREVLERVHDEVCAASAESVFCPDDLARMPFSRAVVQEVLRLFPPVWAINRWLINDVSLGAHKLKGGSYVIISPFAIHRSTAHWDSPDEFRPQRFEAAAHGIDKSAYMPFGFGPRACIGSRFALLEIQMCLVMLARKYRWYCEDQKSLVPQAVVTLRPQKHVLLHFSEWS